MSILKYVKTSKCPHCGCSTVISERIETEMLNQLEIRHHCNGGRWETRTFACGQVVKYIPNYSCDVEYEYSECTQNDQYLIEVAKKEAQLDRFKEFLKTEGIPSDEYALKRIIGI